MEQDNLFPGLPVPLTDDETATVLYSVITSGIRRHREADLYLAGICARHLISELRLAGLAVVRALAN